MNSNNSTKSAIRKLDSFINPAIKQSNEIEGFVDDFEFSEDWELDDYQHLSNWNSVGQDGWKLPATSEPHWWCGIFRTRGCLHVEDHNQHGFEGKGYVVKYPQSCFRATCKICYKKWIGRQANRSTRRIEYYSRKTGRQPIHAIVSVSKADYSLDFRQMKEKAREELKELGFYGYALIFHPFRFYKRDKRWYYSPHFHVVGFCSIKEGDIASAYSKYGWFFKNLGVRKSVFSTFYYLLAHCGVKKGFHALSWAGDLSYGKVKIENEPKKSKCPLCGRKLVEVYYTGPSCRLLAEKDFELYVDTSWWHEVHPSEKVVEEHEGFKFSPYKHVNEIIKGLSGN